KFGKTFIVIDKKAVDDIHNNRAVGDAYTITHRKESILKGKGRDIDLLRKENDGRCKVAGGKDAVFNLALASFLDYGNNLDVFKHRLESRSDKYADDDYGVAEKDDIIRNIIDIAKTYGNSKLAKTLENKTYEEQKEYLGKSTSLAKTFLSGVYASLQHYSKTGDRNYEKSFKRGSGYKEMPLGLDKEIDNLISSLSSYIPRYGEIKFTEPITKEYVRAIYDVDGSISKENIAKLQDMGFNVISVSSKDKKLGESLIKTLEEDEKELTLFQNGKEDVTMKSDPSGAIVNSEVYKALKGDKHDDGRITVHKRSTMAGNIPLFKVKRKAFSPSYMIKKYTPEFYPLFNRAEMTQVKIKKKIKEYKEELDSILKPLTEKQKTELFSISDDVTENGMEYVQVIPTKTEKGEQVSLLLDSSKDKFEEFSTNAEAESVAKELRKCGYNTYIDYQNQVFRVFASKDPIRAYYDNERAGKYAMELSKQIALKKGYSLEAWNAYAKNRECLNKIQFECANIHAKIGDTEPIKYLWGYTPYEHSRFGVYVEQKVLDDDGKEKIQHSVIASFRREKDAKKYIRENLLNNPEYKDNTFAIVEQNRNYNNPRVSMDSHYQTIDNDYFHENMVLEYKTEEEREKDFQRMTSVFPEIKKLIDSDFIRQPMSAESFVALINDSKKLKQAGIDKVKLAKELNKGHINDFFKGRKKVKKGELKDFFVTHIGNQAKNRYNYKRKLGATGSNPDRERAWYDHRVYMAKHNCNAELYHLITKQWEHSYGSNYEEDIKNGKPLTDKQQLNKRFIEDVMGIPNHFDEALSETISEIPYFGELMDDTFGHGWFTRLLKNGMEVTAVCKLGLFRITAILAQYGTLINSYSMAGSKRFLNAVTKVPTWHEPEKYKPLFEKLGISNGYVGIESDVMDNPDSIMNSTKVGKVLQWTMKGFEKADIHCRRIAAVAGYDKALDELHERNKTRKEKWTREQMEEMATEKALEFVRDTNFNYSRIDAPGLFTEGGSLLALLLQFKKYPMKELEFLYKLTRLPENPTKQDIKERRARLIRFFVPFVVASGMFGLPAVMAADELAEWIFGISPKQTTKDLLYEWAGNDPVKKQLVIFNLYGLPGNAGVDFSRNIGLGDAVPTEGKELLGPTISSISDMYNGFKYNQSANNILLNELRNLSPVFANTYQAFTGKQRDWKKGLDTTDYTPTERFAKLLGFRPIRESMDKDMAYSLSNKTKKLSDDKKAAIYRYIDDPSNENEQMLKKYNIKKEEVKKVKEQLTKSKLSTSASHVNSKNKSKEYEELRKQRDNYVDFSGEGE
ncbi:hypothetical protein, partial [Veillonella montpellierensis]|uniref:hypothetical protein n=1 Tax=Veillonella montpellierensis TaxID=187328 RepID=UPI00056DBECD